MPGESDTLRVARLGRERDHAAVAANLYNALRTLDAARVDLILAGPFSDESGSPSPFTIVCAAPPPAASSASTTRSCPASASAHDYANGVSTAHRLRTSAA